MHDTGLFSDGSALFVKPVYPARNQWVRIRLRAYREAAPANVRLRTAPDGEEVLTPMRRVAEDAVFQWWEARVRLTVPVLHYRFVLQDGLAHWHYNQAGCYRYDPGDGADFRLLSDYRPPAWLHERVFYQIFPDRFDDGDPATNVSDGEYEYDGARTRARRWGQTPHAWRTSRNLDFFGGDLAGIRRRIPYLLDLGVNALYLNPVFQAPSNHKYDTQDYYRIDPHFGTNADFATLTAELHRHDIRVILDGVFNHTGTWCEWFRAAQRDPHSPYAQCYRFTPDRQHYHAWLGVASLPTLDYRAPLTRDLIYRNDDAVARFWLKPPYHADGWRLDVANMVARNGADQLHREVWRECRQAVKATNPDAWLMGEHFFDPAELLQGDMLDAAMNYHGFTRPLWTWLSGQTVRGEALACSAADMAAQVQSARSRLPWQLAIQQFNLLNGHDLRRLSGIFPDPRQNRLAALLLFTWPGVPCMYYGEEIGLRGRGKHADTDRLCMIWEEKRWNKGLRRFYQRLIQLRTTTPALQTGSFQILLAAGKVCAYARFDAAQVWVIVLNNGPAAEVVVDVKPVGLTAGARLQGEDAAYTVTEAGLCLEMEAFAGVMMESTK